MKSRAIRIGDGADGLLGGHPPNNVSPRDPNNHFFVSVRIDPQCWVSVFVRRDYSQLMDSLRLGRIVDLPPTLEIQEHTYLERRAHTSRYAFELSAHGLSVGPPRDDLMNGVPSRRTKLGGRAFAESSAVLASDLEAAESSGFHHFLQIGFGSAFDEPPVSGNWPLGDRRTSFYRHEKESNRWRVLWRGL